MGYDYDTSPERARAVAKIQKAQLDRHAQVDREVEAAVGLARRYAEHLAGGGDPADYPTVGNDRSWATESYLVSPFLGLVEVYDEWNLARVRPNPQRPFRNKSAWRVGEAFIASIGTPILYADLSEVYHQGTARSTRISSDQIARIAYEFERPSDAEYGEAEYGTTDLVARKTKVGGKATYLVRERRDDDRKPDESETGWTRYYAASGLPEEKWTP